MTTRRRARPSVRIWVVICLAAVLAPLLAVSSHGTPAAAEPTTMITTNGDPANRVDVAILGDGYTSAEMNQYATDAANAAAGLLGESPFDEYSTYFNVHRVDVVSAQSGSDHPELQPATYVDTALDSTYNCSNIVRLICVNTAKVSTILGNTLAPDERDIVLVLVNDTTYGGSGGSVAVASTNGASIELVLHELGHSFGQLADEYGAGAGVACNPLGADSKPNLTTQTVRESIKWSSWISASTAVPTVSSAPSVPGLYEGGGYCDTGVYRPTFNSKMRSLNQPYDQVNGEQLVRQIYDVVSPIDTISPAGDSVTSTPGGSQVFTVTTPQPSTHSLDVRWLVDGIVAASTPTFQIQFDGFEPGPHTVDVEVSDPTDLVRDDPSQLLRESHTWSFVTAGGTATAPDAPSAPSVKLGPTQGHATVSWSPPANDGGGVISGYRVLRGVTSNSLTQIGATNAITTQYLDTAASTGTSRYFYAIVAQNWVGDSPASAETVFAPVTVSVSDASVLEPAVAKPAVTGRVRITLNQPAATDTKVKYYTVDGSASGAASGSDYKRKGTSAKPATATIKAGKVSAAVAVRIRPDADIEADETFAVHLVSVTTGTAVIDDADGQITIRDSDSIAAADPVLVVTDAWIAEGGFGGPRTVQLLAQLDRPLASDLRLEWHTVDGTAIQPSDYTKKKPTKPYIRAGKLFAVLTVKLKADVISEGDEALLVPVSVLTGGPVTVVDTLGAIVIRGDD